MKQAAIGALFGVIVSSGVWVSVLQLAPPSSSARAQIITPSHDVDHLQPAARRSIQAFNEIARSLNSGNLKGVREKALEIESFFAPMNAEIARNARALANSTEVDTARSRFRSLTEAFQHPPVAKPHSGYSL